jgi:peptide deformylase
MNPDNISKRDHWTEGNMPGTALISLFVLFSCYYFYYANADDLYRYPTFKISSSVSIPVNSSHSTLIYEKLIPSCTSYLVSNPSVCGMAAPNFGYFIRYMCLRNTLDGTILHIANPKYDSSQIATKSTKTSETSTICPDTSAGIEKQRSNVVNAEYYDLQQDKSIQKEVAYNMAICFQHHADVLYGSYPCVSSPMRPDSIKTLPLSK